MTIEEVRDFVNKYGVRFLTRQGMVNLLMAFQNELERQIMERDFRVASGVVNNPIPQTTYGRLVPERLSKKEGSE
jgi:hypothetical protein